jgi:hypothetical protein
VRASQFDAVDEQLDVCANTLAVGDIGLAGRHELEAEDVVAFGDGCDRLHLEALVGNVVVTLGQLAVLNVRRRSRRRRRPSTAAGRSLPLLGTLA